MTSRILVDITANLQPAAHARNSIVRIERELGRRLISDSSLNTLPIVFSNGVIYAVDRERALSALNQRWAQAIEVGPGDARRGTVSYPGAVIPSAADEISPAKRNGLRSRILRAGLRIAIFAGRRVVKYAPRRARAELRLSLLHARNALVAMSRPSPTQIVEALSASPTAQDLVANGVASIATPKVSTLKLTPLSLVVHPCSSDVIWTCGAAAQPVPLRQLAEQKPRAQFRLASICHDIHAVRQVAWSASGLAGLEAASTIDQLDVSDLIFCISSSIRESLEEFATDNYRRAPSLEVLTPGVDILCSAQHIGSEPDGLNAGLKRRFALAVGKVDIHKNYGLLAQVWQHLVGEPQFDLDLVIAGHPGDAIADLSHKMEGFPNLRKRVHFVGEVTDAELVKLYKTCQVQLCTTLDDTWDLSLREGLAYGARVICSDRAALREATCGKATYIDPANRSAWIGAIREAASSVRADADDLRFSSWDDGARRLAEELTRLAASRPGR